MIVSKIVILFFITTVGLFPQSMLENQYQYAQSLFNNEKFFDAVTEFKRLVFFDKENTYTYKADYMIASSYKAGGKFEDAIKYYSLSQKYSTETDELYKSKIGVIRCNILRRSTEQALILLDQLRKEYPLQKENITYWQGWSYIFSGEWDKAAEEFRSVSYDTLTRICNQTSEDEYSVTFAKIISYIIPGLGQIYTGNVLSGFMSSAWNALFLYLSINSFNQNRILDGFIYTGLFFRFHRGNVQNAGKFAINNNVEITNKTLKILEEYKGEKP